jgi:glutathione S-transferase
MTPRSSKLYVIASSHPCATVVAALRLKGIGFRVVELPPELHRVHQRLRFGRPRVPSIVLDGQKLIGSRAIVHRLDELVPDPPLLSADPARRAAVEDAERWGDEVLQDVARRIGIAAHLRRPDALPSYVEDSRFGRPAWLVRLAGPLAMRSAARFHRARSRGSVTCARLLEGRPALGLGERLFPELRGRCPAGALPGSWLEHP